MNARVCLLFAFVAVATLVVRSETDVEARQRARNLLAQLVDALQISTTEHAQAIPGLQAEVAAMGDRALAVLEEELRVGIKFAELNKLLSRGRSQRLAAAMVLAEIPGDASARLLYKSAFDVPDNGAMHNVLLDAMKKRPLDEEMVLGLPGHNHPDFVRAAIDHATRMTNSPVIVARLSRLLNEDNLLGQFVNEHGKSTTSEEMRWRVRLEAGRALGKDMSEEVRTRARMILESLAELSTELRDVKQTSTYGALLSAPEIRAVQGIDELVELGDEPGNIVKKAESAATAEYADLLAMVAARSGNQDAIRRVIDILSASPFPSLRICAAVTLRRIRTPEAKAALWEALQDPYRRGYRRRMLHPVREIASSALVELGEDFTRVNQAKSPNHPESALPPHPSDTPENRDER